MSRADGIERLWVSIGERGRANISISISIECSPGYGGEDCETAYTCRENVTCNQTLSYCNNEGECLCRDGSTECAPCNEDISCTSTTSTPTTSGTGGGGTDLNVAPIIAGVLVSVILVLVIIVIIVVVVVMLCYKKKLKERQKAGELAAI